ncbi:hypothetical protein [Nocardia sp. NPDC060259]
MRRAPCGQRTRGGALLCQLPQYGAFVSGPAAAGARQQAAAQYALLTNAP